MAAPLVMVSLWALASVLRPGYNQLTQKGSELGTGPNSLVMNANFVVTGLLILIFRFGLLKNIDAEKWSQVGLIFLAIAGVGEVATGIFPCDPGCPLTGSSSQLIHTGIAVVFLWRDGPLPSLHWSRSEPGSILDTLSFVFPSDRIGEYRALHCIFCCCPNLISLRGIVATILSRCTVSMDRDNGESASLFHKVSKKFGCKIAAPYQLLGRSGQTRDAAR